MAIKPPDPREVFEHFSSLAMGSSLRGEVEKSVRSLTQSALARLDVVSREEFDAQTEVLQRTRSRVAALEAELEELGRELEGLAGQD